MVNARRVITGNLYQLYQSCSPSSFIDVTKDQRPECYGGYQDQQEAKWPAKQQYKVTWLFVKIYLTLNMVYKTATEKKQHNNNNKKKTQERASH